MSIETGEELLRVEHVGKTFLVGGGLFKPKLKLRALQDISFSIQRGETLGIVGESGCGKSTLGRCILQLLRPDEGKVLWLGKDLMALDHEAMRKKRSDLQIGFITTLTKFSAPGNVTLDELKIESYYPLDRETEQVCKRLQG